MWSWLASLIGGPIITGLINAYKAKLDAGNMHDRIAADLAAKEIGAEIKARKQASAIIIAEQSGKRDDENEHAGKLFEELAASVVPPCIDERVSFMAD